MDWILAHYADILAVVGAVVSLATVIVGLTPTTKDDEILGKIVRILDYISVLPVKKQMQAALPYAIAALVAVAATIWGVNALISHADKGGYSRCVAEVKTNEAEHLAKSVGAINEAFSKVQILEDELGDYQDGKASPSLERTLLNHKLRNDKKPK